MDRFRRICQNEVGPLDQFRRSFATRDSDARDRDTPRGEVVESVEGEDVGEVIPKKRHIPQPHPPLTHDGPFVDTKEALNGYLIYEGADLDAAIELAGRIPAARLGGAIEVRPIMEW